MNSLKALINLAAYSISFAKKNGLSTTSKKALDFISERGLSAFWNTAVTSSSSAPTAIGSSYQSSHSGYFEDLQSSASRSAYFAEFEDRSNNLPKFENKIVCFYLPQFHPFKENNEFWGEGFTEWTNVTKSFPLFKGHNQPRYPKDLGYYDLRLKDTIAKQADIARNYGVHGFCLHYYWFSGQKVMDTPLNILHQNKDIKINFSLCWANENWTRRWDGLEQDVLLRQLDTENDYHDFIAEVSQYFDDERYIKVNNCPLLVIYRPELIKNLKKAVEIWRDFAKKKGHPDLHLIMSESFEDKAELGVFDAAVDFAPNNYKPDDITRKQTFYHPNFQGHVFSYESVVKYSLSKKKTFPFYHSICMEWDNSARKGARGTIFHGCNRTLFENWLQEILKKKILNNTVFINAWNEWAEGTYLEPDRKNGFAYLQGIYEQLNKADSVRHQMIEASHKQFKKQKNKAIIFHIHYFDSFETFIKNYHHQVDEFDFVFTITPNINAEQIKTIQTHIPNAVFFAFENRGRDVLPFLTVLKSGLLDQYDSCLKLHSKKSVHMANGSKWRDELYQDLMKTKSYEKSINASTKKVVLWSNQANIKPIENRSSINFKRLSTLLKSNPENATFITGTMFWFRPSCINSSIPKEILDLEFEAEPLPIDGSWAHVLERYIGAKIAHDGFTIQAVEEQ